MSGFISAPGKAAETVYTLHFQYKD
jgi:hypothetical protein